VKRFSSLVLLSVATLSLTVSCNKFMGNLRRDLNDMDYAKNDLEVEPSEPTVGGTWWERGYLGSPKEERDRYTSLGRTDRTPAGAGQGNSPQQRNWVSPQESEANRRDLVRGNPVSTNTVPNMEPEKKRQYKNGSRATRDDFVDQSQEEGSLWASSGQTNYYFTKNKVRSLGDLVTLTIEKDLYRDITTEIKRTLSPKEKASEIGMIQDQYRAKFVAELEMGRKDNLSTSAAAPEKTTSGGNPPAAEPSSSPSSFPSPSPSFTPADIDRMVPKATIADVDIVPLVDIKAGETMMGEIIERFPNGNFKIRTVKRIPYKRGPPRIVTVVGVVRSSDITEDTDLVTSGKLYEYRVEVAH